MAAFIEATYEQLARLGDSSLCCSPVELYAPEDLALLPDEVLRLSSGCGNPVEDAAITPGMTVLDIGSGSGADAILAARRTGPDGTVIGVDPSCSMRQRAIRNAADLGLTWIEFRAGTAESLPVPDRSVDLAISNCVLSLSTDSARAWTEIARTLRPGGQIVVSDIVGGATAETLDAKTRCETGIEWPDYQALLTRLGFTGIRPLRVRAARYRDGSTARSVTIHARYGLPHPHAAVDLIQNLIPYRCAGELRAQEAELRAQEAELRAQELVASLHHIFAERVDVRLLDAADPAGRDVIALLHGNGPPQAETAVAVNGLTVPICAEDLPSRLRNLLV
jgi:SAM-dependent methyltransferase